MNRRCVPLLILAVVCTLSMLLMPSQSMQGAYEGINLCLKGVIPSLFPFFICSRMLISSGLPQLIGSKVGRLFEWVFGINRYCSFAFLAGLISGYPIGAKIGADLYKEGICSKGEAQRLIAFCNNSGPLFIIGTVGVGMLGSAKSGVILYIAHILASVGVGIIMRFVTPSKMQKSHLSFHASSVKSSFHTALTDSVKSMALVCGNIIFFSVVSVPLRQVVLHLTPSPMLQGSVCGLLEISTGISLISKGQPSLPVIGFLLGWSGISVIMQVDGIISSTNLSTFTFALSKFIHGILAYLFTLLIMEFLPMPPSHITARIPTASNALLMALVCALAVTLLAVVTEKLHKRLQ